ncbi:hypothetical protein [Parathalassolituus penaei]|uniref:Uncharacterized protein n=1 Tax=Parathalassolituus penaei TaxID=2997323 RepID=A0A9X3EN90_9GAMM|nr:hypothetical protein [Parathalassolituus penaei]MCY0967321.1 hypothetical protein [Parathalassolituus penaei]
MSIGIQMKSDIGSVAVIMLQRHKKPTPARRGLLSIDEHCSVERILNEVGVAKIIKPFLVL